MELEASLTSSTAGSQAAAATAVLTPTASSGLAPTVVDFGSATAPLIISSASSVDEFSEQEALGDNIIVVYSFGADGHEPAVDYDSLVVPVPSEPTSVVVATAAGEVAGGGGVVDGQQHPSVISHVTRSLLVGHQQQSSAAEVPGPPPAQSGVGVQLESSLGSVTVHRQLSSPSSEVIVAAKPQQQIVTVSSHQSSSVAGGGSIISPLIVSAESSMVQSHAQRSDHRLTDTVVSGTKAVQPLHRSTSVVVNGVRSPSMAAGTGYPTGGKATGSQKCPICHIKVQQLKAHIRRKHEKIHKTDKYNGQCPLCEKQFCDDYKVRRHINQVHQNIRPHVCNLCGKRFCENKDLRRHICGVHLGQRNLSGYKSKPAKPGSGQQPTSLPVGVLAPGSLSAPTASTSVISMPSSSSPFGTDSVISGLSAQMSGGNLSLPVMPLTQAGPSYSGGNRLGAATCYSGSGLAFGSEQGDSRYYLNSAGTGNPTCGTSIQTHSVGPTTVYYSLDTSLTSTMVDTATMTISSVPPDLLVEGQQEETISNQQDLEVGETFEVADDVPTASASADDEAIKLSSGDHQLQESVAVSSTGHVPLPDQTKAVAQTVMQDDSNAFNIVEAVDHVDLNVGENCSVLIRTNVRERDEGSASPPTQLPISPQGGKAGEDLAGSLNPVEQASRILEEVDSCILLEDAPHLHEEVVVSQALESVNNLDLSSQHVTLRFGSGIVKPSTEVSHQPMIIGETKLDQLSANFSPPKFKSTLPILSLVRQESSFSQSEAISITKELPSSDRSLHYRQQESYRLISNASYDDFGVNLVVVDKQVPDLLFSTNSQVDKEQDCHDEQELYETELKSGEDRVTDIKIVTDCDDQDTTDETTVVLMMDDDLKTISEVNPSPATKFISLENAQDSATRARVHTEMITELSLLEGDGKSRVTQQFSELNSNQLPSAEPSQQPSIYISGNFKSKADQSMPGLKCVGCLKRFVNWSFLKSHMATVHGWMPVSTAKDSPESLSPSPTSTVNHQTPFPPTTPKRLTSTASAGRSTLVLRGRQYRKEEPVAVSNDVGGGGSVAASTKEGKEVDVDAHENSRLKWLESGILMDTPPESRVPGIMETDIWIKKSQLDITHGGGKVVNLKFREPPSMPPTLRTGDKPAACSEAVVDGLSSGKSLLTVKGGDGGCINKAPLASEVSPPKQMGADKAAAGDKTSQPPAELPTVACAEKGCDRKFCGKERSKQMRRHVDRVHKKIRKNRCHLCPEAFYQKQDLVRHIDSHHEGLKFLCPMDGCLKLIYRLDLHIKYVHSNKPRLKKRNSCPDCDMTFNRIYDVKRHRESVHLGYKKFKCDICDKSFTDKRDLNRHKSALHERVKSTKERVRQIEPVDQPAV